MTDDRFNDVVARTLGASRSPETCPDAEQLAAFVERALAGPERALCIAHLAECARCQAHVAALIRSVDAEQTTGDQDVGWAKLWWWLDWRGLTGVAAIAAVIIAVRMPGPATLPGVSAPGNVENELRQDAAARNETGPVTESASESIPSARIRESSIVEPTIEPPVGALGRARISQQALPLAAESGAQVADAVAPARALAERLVVSSEQPRQVIVVAPGGTVVWRTRPGGVIEGSVDGGATWSLQLRREDVQWQAGSAPTSAVCWWVGTGGEIARTTDGGNTWTRIIPPAAIDADTDFVDVRSTGAETAEVSHANGQVSVTTDGGDSWATRP